MLKLKSAIKKLPSLTKRPSGADHFVPAKVDVQAEGDPRTVYVGKSRRRYVVSSKVVDHPLFREIADKSMVVMGESERKGPVVVVSCEVVLFEHLLWMLEGGGGCDQSLDDLVEFYTCVN